MNNSQKIAFVGPKEYANAMRFAGFECFKVFNKKESLEKIEELKKEDYALIFVSQDVCPDDIGFDRVVSLPGTVQASDDNYLKEEIKKAVGGEMDL